MEIAIFFGGTTSTASDQSISANPAHSGSLVIPASICASVSLSTFFQSVFPRLRSPRDTTVIFFSFITLGSASGNESTHCPADRANDNDFSAFERSQRPYIGLRLFGPIGE